MDDLKHFRAQAIIFDKDGTLIDFDAMWGGWAIYLAQQLQHVSGLNVEVPLYLALGYDHTNKKVLAHGNLAANPMAQLFHLTVEVMQSMGLSKTQAEHVAEQAWYIPDPVILAKPFTNTRELFRKLTEQKIQIAIATSDDCAPTQATVEALDIEEFITTMVCADDGIPAKPAPDVVLTICERMKVDPAKVMVVGDTTTDLKMARAANAGLAVGVLSGVSSAKDLIPHADVLIDSVAELHAYAEMLAEHAAAQRKNGLNPDFAF